MGKSEIGAVVSVRLSSQVSVNEAGNHYQVWGRRVR